jgi:hypothetical protein
MLTTSNITNSFFRPELFRGLLSLGNQGLNRYEFINPNFFQPTFRDLGVSPPSPLSMMEILFHDGPEYQDHLNEPAAPYYPQAYYPYAAMPYGMQPPYARHPYGYGFTASPTPWAIYPPHFPAQNSFPMPFELPSDKAMELAEYVTENVSGGNTGLCLTGAAEAISENYLGLGNTGSGDRHREGGFYSYFEGQRLDGRIDHAKNAGPALEAMFGKKNKNGEEINMKKIGSYNFLEEMKESGQTLIPGDILVFEPDGGHPAGHIAIVGSDGRLYADGVEGQAGQVVKNFKNVEERYMDFTVYRDKGSTTNINRAKSMLEGGGFIDGSPTENPWGTGQYPNQVSAERGSGYRLDETTKEKYLKLLQERAKMSIQDFDAIARNVYDTNGTQNGLKVSYEEFQEALLHIAYVESSFNPQAGNTAGDGQRVQGLFQFKPSTAEGLGIGTAEQLRIDGKLLDPKVSIEAGAKYLAVNLKKHDGDLEKAVISHNTGTNGVNGPDWKANLSDEAGNYLTKFNEVFKERRGDTTFPTPPPYYAQTFYGGGYPAAYYPPYPYQYPAPMMAFNWPRFFPTPYPMMGYQFA